MHVELFGYEMEIDETYVEAPPAEIRRQVSEYAAGDRRTFDLDVAYPDGFGGEVMRAMAEIPYGETRTYGAIAADLDTAPVAVGQACGRNPVGVVVPCHRVVGADGGLHGFSADGGVAFKRRLLAHEREHAGDDAARTLDDYLADAP